MKKIILIFSVCLFISCGSTKTKDNPNCAEKKPTKTLVIVGDDRSGSTEEIRKLTATDYKDIATIITNLGGGTLAVEIIGNTSPSDKECYRLTLDQLKPHEIQSIKDPTLTQDEEVNLKNKKIDEENQSIKTNNLTKIDSFISTINEKAINYKPKNKDLTDVNDALKQINTLVNEPNFEDYDRIIIALFCDGVNQPHSNKIEPLTVKLESSKPFILYTIGWKDLKYFENISSKAAFASKDGFIETLKKINCN